MHPNILAYNEAQVADRKPICDLLAQEIAKAFPETNTNAKPEITSKIWHSSPVWFIEGNPTVGYDVLKNYVRLLFWSGESFEEAGLKKEGTFKAAEARYTSIDEVNVEDLARWLEKSKQIQWDYKNIRKRQGVLERIE